MHSNLTRRTAWCSVDRDDMGGIGSFERQNTTLYIGHVDINDNMESIVRRHFSEWGEIEHSNYYSFWKLSDFLERLIFA